MLLLSREFIIYNKNYYSNILLTTEKNIKISDFGLSSIIPEYRESEFLLTPMIGTVPYMSPEIRIGRQYDYKIDIWYVHLMNFRVWHKKEMDTPHEQRIYYS